MTKYTDRTITPLGTETGFTSTPVSLPPSRSRSPKHPINSYVYQPAALWTHPDAVPGPTRNYLDTVERRKASKSITDAGRQTVEANIERRKTDISGGLEQTRQEQGRAQACGKRNDIEASSPLHTACKFIQYCTLKGGLNCYFLLKDNSSSTNHSPPESLSSQLALVTPFLHNKARNNN
jgi:hypothetical protein